MFMRVSCVCVCVFNEICSILMIRKGTLKLFSFWKWNDGRFGVVTGCLESRKDEWSEGVEKLEHGLEVKMWERARDDTGRREGGSRAARRCWEGESVPLILEMSLPPTVNKSFAFKSLLKSGSQGEMGIF